MKALRRNVCLAPLPLVLLVMGCAEQVDVQPPPKEPRAVLVVAAPAEVVAVAPTDARPAVVPSSSLVAEPSSGAAPTAVTSDAGLETWASRHSEAAKALGTWVHNNPEAAAKIFSYDLRRPGRSRELVRWAIYHPGEDISVFTSKHPDWGWFDHVMAEHRLGADQFLGWCRQYPTAAEELIKHPSGLRWVGDHLYSADWHPESG
jgi:hypothetical protein